MSGPKKTILKHIEKFKQMIKPKFTCPHCGSDNLHREISSIVDGRDREHEVTGYTCKECKFYGTHTKFSIKEN